MGMSEQEFEQRVRTAEALAQRNFPRYRRNVRWFALLGYLVIFVMLAVLVAMVGGMVALAFFSSAALILLVKSKLIFVLLPAIWVILKSLWVKLDPPAGYEMHAAEFPLLHREVDGLSNALDAPKIDSILLVPECNASIVQTPRLGLLGWQRSTLILGLELLLMLTPAQARAVIAHELGHLSGNHSAFAGWIYRVRETWNRILWTFNQQQTLGSGLMNRFFSWYAPRFAAYSFALARRNEFEADAVAAELTSPGDTAAALVNSHIAGRYADETYWREYFASADDNEQPQQPPWSGLRKFLLSESLHDGETRLETAMNAVTGYADTHPALPDRLRALGIAAPTPAVPGESAAALWLGDALDSVTAEFDQQWLALHSDRWRERFNYVRQGRTKLTDYRAQATDAMADTALWEFALLTEEFGERREALALLRNYEQRHPEDADCAFVQGRILYAEKDESCLAALERAARRVDLAPDACRYAFYFLSDQGRTDEAAQWAARIEAADTEAAKAHDERAYVRLEDVLVEPDISEQRAQALIERLMTNRRIKRAWLARKVTRYHTQVPAYAVAVKVRGFILSEAKLRMALHEEFGADVDAWIVPMVGEFKPLAKRIAKHGKRVK